jgi:uncharacterized protein (TIGR01777 family)
MDSLDRSSGIILSGSSGMLGTALRREIESRGDHVLQLVRRDPTSKGQLKWDPGSDRTIENPAALGDAESAIHLSGASVAGHRWTDQYKREMTESRVDSTRRLAAVLANLNRPPKSFLVASAVGIYGNRGDEVLDETAAAGTGFLADVCRQWEEAAKPAEDAGIRVVHLRFGVVLGPEQGALKQMLPPFRVGLGAKLGSGRQWMSWVGLSDVIAAILFAMEREDLVGPVNVASQNPVTNAEFTKALGQQLGRPAVLTVPRFALRLMLGQMADEALLASARVRPAKLLAAGFEFSLPEIQMALASALG